MHMVVFRFTDLAPAAAAGAFAAANLQAAELAGAYHRALIIADATD